jgi:hypothetical protein
MFGMQLALYPSRKKLTYLMKKIVTTLLVSAALMTAANTRAQNVNVHESTISFGKTSQSAVIGEYDAPASVVEEALKLHMEKAGLDKRKSEKGFMAFKGAAWNEVSADKADVYLKVEGKGNKSTISVLYSKGYDNFVTASSNPETVNAIKSFLTNFVADLKKYQLMQDIAHQEDALKKAEKAYASSVTDGKSLADDKVKIEKKIADNTNEQGDKQKAVDAEKKKLEDLKAMLGQ